MGFEVLNNQLEWPATFMTKCQREVQPGSIKSYGTAPQYWREEQFSVGFVSYHGLERKREEKNKSFADAVMLSVMDPGR